MLDCIRSAEEKLGRPPSQIEVFVEMTDRYPSMPVKHCYASGAVIGSLLREDWIYTNKIASHVSLTRHEGYETFSEKFRSHFKGNYETCRDGSIITSKSGRKLNLDNITDMLKSKDASLYEKNKWVFDGEYRFLDESPLTTKIAFCTFPRSGNSLMRRLLENATGIATGSAGTLATGTFLQLNGLKGQQVYDNRVWITKAHHPCLQPGVGTFMSDKVLCVVRNPLDVIPSFAQLANTMSHSAKAPFDYEVDYPEWFDWWARLLCDQQCKYFESLITNCDEKGMNPIYIVRYEDLCLDYKTELKGMMKLILDLETLEGTNIERRMNDMGDMSEAGKTYQLKGAT
jgi:hypothetical protein